MWLRLSHSSRTEPALRLDLSMSWPLAILMLLVAATSTAPARAAFRAEAPAEVATLTGPHQLVSLQGKLLERSRTVRARRPITGVRTALPVIGETVTPAGVRLLHVLLPGRPNGSNGWIKQEATTLASTSWRVVIRTASRRVLVFHDGHLERMFIAIVGKASTPTPRGHFFVEESVRMPNGSAGGPYALALSAHSDVLQEFEGGPGQIAIHGIAELPGKLGTAESHGCIRLNDRGIRWMAAHVAPGVSVFIMR